MPDEMHANEFERRAGLLRSSVLRGVLRHGPSVAGHAARVTLWGIVHFAFVLTQQVAELLSPMLLVVGAGWYLLPRAIGLVQTNDGQMHDVLNGLVQRVPTELTVEGYSLTPTGLIFDGVLLMVVAAGLSTLTAVLANELYRDR